jgi:F0F1-type ATP synthase membrane subunit b/b'
MIIRPRHLLLALLTGVLATGLCPVQADDAEMVKEKLFQAKKEYDAEVQKFKKAISETFDRREDDARKKGDKKQVDQIKGERDAFEKTGELPQMVPSSIREPARTARAKLVKDYAASIKEYVRLKMDEAAAATEKELLEFQITSGLMFGKRIYLVALKHFDVKVDNRWAFANNGTADGEKIKIDGRLIPHSINFVPPEKGIGEVSYPLAGKWTVFRATIGVPKTRDKAEDPHSSLTFEAVGDGKSLWKSEPVSKLDTFQTCTINIDKVKTLTLRVHCPGSNGWAATCWIEPILVE